MIKRYAFDSLGSAHFGWLDTRHHFSFGRYVNRDRTQFGALRVINDDRIAPGTGFDTHPHDNMEIITYVRKGAITHQDSLGNKGRTAAGDVQVMSAGSGIWHSEFNNESTETVLYQIWILPNQQNVKPRWESAEFPKASRDTLTLLVSGRPEDAQKGVMRLHQDAAIWGGTLSKGVTIDHAIKHQAYLLVSSGALMAEEIHLESGDGAEITNQKSVKLCATTPDCEVLLIDVPA